MQTSNWKLLFLLSGTRNFSMWFPFLPDSVRDAKFHLVSSHQIKLDPDANEAGTPQNADDHTTSPEQPANQSQLKQLSLPSSVQLGRGSRTLQLQCYAEVLAVLEVGGSAASLEKLPVIAAFGPKLTEHNYPIIVEDLWNE